MSTTLTPIDVMNDPDEQARIKEEIQEVQPMTRAEVLARLRWAVTDRHDPEKTHIEADHWLLGLINDPEITRYFCSLLRWYD